MTRVASSGIMAELRYAARSLGKHPAFTLTVVCTLALGVAVCATVFSVVNGVLLQQLPYASPEELVLIWSQMGKEGESTPAVSPPDYLDYKKLSETFDGFAAASGAFFVGATGNLSGEEAPDRVEVATVTEDFFPLLGVDPILGRHFLPSEVVPNGPKVVMISHRLWTRRYGSDPNIVGKTIRMDGLAYTVVGVLPESFRLHLPAEAVLIKHSEVWSPLQFDLTRAVPRTWTILTVIGRLKDGVPLEKAQAEMDRIAANFRLENPEHREADMHIRLVPLHQDVVKKVARPLLLLLGAAAFVLLVACVNIANLTIVRGAARAQELAVRYSLGASRWSVVRLQVVESMLLALISAVVGLGLTHGAMTLMSALLPADLPRMTDITIDGTVIGFGVAIGLLTVLGFGLLPALWNARLDLASVLRKGGRSGSGSQGRLHAAMVAVEVALALALLVGAGLLMRTFAAIQKVRPGFDSDHVVTFKLALPNEAYPEQQDRLRFYVALEERLGALPGVESVGSIFELPLSGSGEIRPYAYDETTSDNWESVSADVRHVTDGYFKTMGSRLIAGRFFDERENTGEQAIIIDETLAERAFKGQSAVGKRLQINPIGGRREPYAAVVGVVEHQRLHDLTRNVREQYFRSYRQIPGRHLDVAIRTTLDPEQIIPSLRREITAMDPDLPVEQVRLMEAYISDAMALSRLSFVLMSLFGVLALFLAALGIYGVIAYAVTQRQREIGIRIALGGGQRSILKQVVLWGAKPILAGVGIGLLLSLALSKALESLLFDVSPRDPLALAQVSLLLIVVALLACYIPARKATRINPASALANSQ